MRVRALVFESLTHWSRRTSGDLVLINSSTTVRNRACCTIPVSGSECHCCLQLSGSLGSVEDQLPSLSALIGVRIVSSFVSSLDIADSSYLEDLLTRR